MPEKHITHAIATFSELGIATASIVIADIPRWRGLVQAHSVDPIDVENVTVMAKKIGGIYSFFIWLANKLPKNNFWIFTPFVSFAFGFIALLGISFCPAETIFGTVKVEHVFWWLALLSFLSSMLCAGFEKSNDKVARETKDSLENIPIT